MASENEPSLHGWDPDIDGDATRAHVIDEAFRYRGDVTLVMTDGTSVAGFVSNRNAEHAPPYFELIAEADDHPRRVAYQEVARIRFTGRDTAAGQSYEAWKKRREQEKA